MKNIKEQFFHEDGSIDWRTIGKNLLGLFLMTMGILMGVRAS